jgi:hypothetical protein
MLPHTFFNMPLKFTAEQLLHLQGSFTLEMIEGELEKMRESYVALQAAVPRFQQFSCTEYEWAMMAASPRFFGIKARSGMYLLHAL